MFGPFERLNCQKVQDVVTLWREANFQVNSLRKAIDRFGRFGVFFDAQMSLCVAGARAARDSYDS